MLKGLLGEYFDFFMVKVVCRRLGGESIGIWILCVWEREGVKMFISNMFNFVFKFNVEIIYGVWFYCVLWKILILIWICIFLVENVWIFWKNLGVGFGFGYIFIILFYIFLIYFINGIYRYESIIIYIYINSFRV